MDRRIFLTSAAVTDGSVVNGEPWKTGSGGTLEEELYCKFMAALMSFIFWQKNDANESGVCELLSGQSEGWSRWFTVFHL